MLVIYVVPWTRPPNLYLDRSTFGFNYVLKIYMISIINACLRSFKGQVKVI